MTSTSTSPIEIRSVAVADFDAWLTLWRGYQAFYKTDIPMDTTLRAHGYECSTRRSRYSPRRRSWMAV
jgi:hypothetical protein